MMASAPPASITSASPRWMIRKASPIAWLPVAQAVTTEEFGPLSLYRMESWPEAMLTISDGMKNGEIRLGPRSRSTLCHSRMDWMPPMPGADEAAGPRGVRLAEVDLGVLDRLHPGDDARTGGRGRAS